VVDLWQSRGYERILSVVEKKRNFKSKSLAKFTKKLIVELKCEHQAFWMSFFAGYSREIIKKPRRSG